MSKLKVQIKSKAQMTNFNKKTFDIESFWHSFDI